MKAAWRDFDAHGDGNASERVAVFLSELGPERVIALHSFPTYACATYVVWYWEEGPKGQVVIRMEQPDGTVKEIRPGKTEKTLQGVRLGELVPVTQEVGMPTETAVYWQVERQYEPEGVWKILQRYHRDTTEQEAQGHFRMLLETGWLPPGIPLRLVRATEIVEVHREGKVTAPLT